MFMIFVEVIAITTISLPLNLEYIWIVIRDSEALLDISSFFVHTVFFDYSAVATIA